MYIINPTYHSARREVLWRTCGCHQAADQQREEQLDGGHGAAATGRVQNHWGQKHTGGGSMLKVIRLKKETKKEVGLHLLCYPDIWQCYLYSDIDKGLFVVWTRRRLTLNRNYSELVCTEKEWLSTQSLNQFSADEVNSVTVLYCFETEIEWVILHMFCSSLVAGNLPKWFPDTTKHDPVGGRRGGFTLMVNNPRGAEHVEIQVKGA